LPATATATAATAPADYDVSGRIYRSRRFLVPGTAASTAAAFRAEGWGARVSVLPGPVHRRPWPVFELKRKGLPEQPFFVSPVGSRLVT